MSNEKKTKPTLLLIDDDIDFSSDFLMLLRDYFECLSAEDGVEGIEIIKKNNIDVILLDLMFENKENGIEVLKKIKNIDANIPVIMITDYASVDTVLEAMKQGAYDYVSKTPNMKELLLKIRQSIDLSEYKRKTDSLKKDASKDYYKIVGKSGEVKKLKGKILLYANNLNTVLITGESGVGKELVARQIHLNSSVKNEAFVAVNCAAIPKDLIESELFGHEKGAFTGANKQKLGKFELASPGTIFLDEISELSLDAQVKLLRVIQNREFERVGGTKTIKNNARIIVATNRNLETMMKEGSFREDLFYRIDVLPIEVPPLRNRKDDIPDLIEHFSEQICYDLKINKKSFSDDAIKILQNYDWPGNIRELQNHVTRAIISSEGEIVTEKDLDSKLKAETSAVNFAIEKIPETWEEMDFVRKKAAEQVSREIEKLFLKNLLEKFNGNISKAAQNIGLNRSSLYKMLKRNNLD